MALVLQEEVTEEDDPEKIALIEREFFDTVAKESKKNNPQETNPLEVEIPGEE